MDCGSVASLRFGDGGMEVDIMANEGKREGGSGASHRGFAAMDQARQRAIASKGGSASGGNFANDPERARLAGRKGGEVSGGNFANDPGRAAEAGRKGGEASRGSGTRSQQAAERANRKPQDSDRGLVGSGTGEHGEMSSGGGTGGGNR